MVKDGFLIPYGVAIDDGESYVHINTLNADEHRGLNCNLVCAECGERLIARFPKTNPDFRSHFAHYVDRDCNISMESLIHKVSKQLIQDEMTMVFPEMVVSYKGHSRRVFEQQNVLFDDVVLETKRTTIDGLSFIPDVIGTYDDVEVFIEIKNTHQVDIEKTAKIESHGVATIEIDVSMITDIHDEEQLRKVVLSSTYNKKWIYLPNRQRVYDDLKSHVESTNKARDERLRLNRMEQRRREAESKRKREESKRNTDELKRNKRDEARYNTIAYYQDELTAAKWKRNMDATLEKHSRYPYLNIDRDDDIFWLTNSYSMNCHYKIWQAYVFDTFIQPGVVIQVKTVVDDLKQEFRNDVDYMLVYLDDIPTRDRIGIRDLTESVYYYFMSLVDKEYVENHGWNSHKYYAKFKVK